MSSADGVLPTSAGMTAALAPSASGTGPWVLAASTQDLGEGVDAVVDHLASPFDQAVGVAAQQAAGRDDVAASVPRRVVCGTYRRVGPDRERAGGLTGSGQHRRQVPG